MFGLQQSVRLSGWNEQPVAGTHFHSVGTDLDDRAACEDNYPFVMVLVVFDGGLKGAAQYLLDDDAADPSHLFRLLAGNRSIDGRSEPTCERLFHDAGLASGDGDSIRSCRPNARASGIAAAPAAARAMNAVVGRL